MSVKWPLLLLFYAVEFFAYALLCFPMSIPFKKAERRDGELHDDLPAEWWWACVILLFLLPLYKLGKYSDLTMRASIPSLFVLSVLVANRIAIASRFTFRTAALILLVFLGTFTASAEMARSMQNMGLSIWIRPAVDIQSVPEMPPEFREQYEGNTSSFFYRYLAAGWRD
jgi:hypothetical protein